MLKNKTVKSFIKFNNYIATNMFIAYKIRIAVFFNSNQSRIMYLLHPQKYL